MCTNPLRYVPIAAALLCGFPPLCRSAGQPPNKPEGAAQVCILAGLPGDDARKAQYSDSVTRLITNLTGRCGVRESSVSVLFGKGDVASYPACDRIGMDRELARIREHLEHGTPVWLFLVGHSNTRQKTVCFNIHGPDVTAAEIAAGLRTAQGRGTLVVFLTTAASGKYLKALAGPNRILVAATAPGAEDNEPEFPHALAGTLADAGSDANGDGKLSVLEIFNATRQRVRAIYEEQDLVVTEQAVLDGDGDGVGTAGPAEKDAAAAAKVALTVSNP